MKVTDAPHAIDTSPALLHQKCLPLRRMLILVDMEKLMSSDEMGLIDVAAA
jgi:hypothetical protein